MLKALPNRIREIVPEADESVIIYCDTQDLNGRILHDMKNEHLTISIGNGLNQ